MIGGILIKCKWVFLRYLVKKRRISFHKRMVRMYHIQQLEPLDKYDNKKLIKLSYRKIRKKFIKEFPNKYLHNPKKDD